MSDTEDELKKEWEAVNERMEEIIADSRKETEAENLDVDKMLVLIEEWAMNYKRLEDIALSRPDLPINVEYVKSAQAIRAVFSNAKEA